MYEKQPDLELESTLTAALVRISHTSACYHLVVPSELPAKKIADKIGQRHQSELINYREPGFLRRIQGKTPEASGTPVILLKETEIIGSDITRNVIQKLIDEDLTYGNRPKISAESKRIYDSISQNTDPQIIHNLLMRILVEKRLKVPMVIIDATPVDVMQNTPENQTAELVQSYKVLCKRKRQDLGKMLKTFKAKTGAQIVIVSNSENNFSSDSGNNGMEPDHDIFSINLVAKKSNISI